MQKNVGSWERTFRIVAGLFIISFAFVGPKTNRAYLGIALLASGVIGWCPPSALSA
ncbi:MAG TPA: DUF2892 domain-containing protein [Nitrospirota bacterium]|nr:DUF2892 domain-containing protein [Nitrospirota bacterium]